MWGSILKGVAGAVVGLTVWAWSLSKEQQERRDLEMDNRMRAGLDDLAWQYYGKSYAELDLDQQRVVVEALKGRW